jgi:hypothetical protein
MKSCEIKSAPTESNVSVENKKLFFFSSDNTVGFLEHHQSSSNRKDYLSIFGGNPLKLLERHVITNFVRENYNYLARDNVHILKIDGTYIFLTFRSDGLSILKLNPSKERVEVLTHLSDLRESWLDSPDFKVQLSQVVVSINKTCFAVAGFRVGVSSVYLFEFKNDRIEILKKIFFQSNTRDLKENEIGVPLLFATIKQIEFLTEQSFLIFGKNGPYGNILEYDFKNDVYRTIMELQIRNFT